MLDWAISPFDLSCHDEDLAWFWLHICSISILSGRNVNSGKSAMTTSGNNPVCVLCTRGCGTKAQKPAMSLLVGWEETIQHIVETRKNNYSTLSDEAKELHYLSFWYQSGRWNPCLYRCLIGALNTILLLALDREKLTEDEANTWIDGRSIYGELGLPASVIVHGADTSTPWHMLDCALAYWVEAAVAHDKNEAALAWQPLLQASMYIGMAAGPISHREVADRGRDTQHARTRKLKQLVLEELKVFADNQFEHSKDTLEALASAKSIIEFQAGKDGMDDILKAVHRLRRDDIKVTQEFGRVTLLEVGPGRPPKLKKQSNPRGKAG